VEEVKRAILTLLAAPAVLLAQAYPQNPALFPQLSPAAEVSQVIGLTKVSIDYHRPAVKGRKIWGDLVPYDQVWRLGANEATTITFSDPVKVDGYDVPAGTYALFAIPRADAWTMILSKHAKQFGAWEYNAKEDLLRWDVRPKEVGSNEWLTFEIYPASASTAYVDLYWEHTRVSFLVETDLDAQVQARLDKALAKARPGDWEIWSQAAEYCAEQEVNLQKAMEWIERSLRIQENGTNLFVKARLQRALGLKDESMKTLDKALAAAKAKHAAPAVVGPIEETKQRWGVS
jgi:tetratricopeptide (TPR) repeat protein